MPFIGKNPTSGFSTIVKDDLTPDGSTTAFTLSKNVASANDIAVFVGNVRQEPTDAYSVSGTTLTMTGAVASGLNFYVLHIAGTTESSVVPAAGTTVPGAFGVSGDFTVDTNILKVDSTNNRVGIGELSPQTILHVTSTSPRITMTDTNTGADSRINADSGAGNLAFDVDYNSETSAPSVVFNIKGSEKLRILNGGGITFNGDTSAANALDDYEEGTLTPTLSCTGGNTGIVYVTQVGRYVKIGNMVHVNLYIELSSKGSASGNVRISGAGFPFTPINTAGFVQVGQVSLNGTVNGQQFDGSNDVWGQLSPGDATLRIYADSDGNVVQLDTGDISGTSFRVNISYFV